MRRNANQGASTHSLLAALLSAAIVFGAGEVRPGESLLTMYTAQLTRGNVYGAIYGSLSTVLDGGHPMSLEDALSYALQQDAPQEDVTVLVRIQTTPGKIVRHLGLD